MGCHPDPAPHGDHTVLAGGANNYPGISETYAIGRFGTTAPYNVTLTLTCTNSSCHASMNTGFVARPSCLNCHTVSKDGHGDITQKHTTAELTAGCTPAGCHTSPVINDEHAARTNPATGQPYDCDVCHNNPDPVRAAAVKAAIDANDPDCSACHLVSDHRALHESEPAATGCTGSSCHFNNLADEHEARTDSGGTAYDCSVCHSPTARQEAQDAIEAYRADGTKATCSTCHAAAAGHHALHEYASLDPSCLRSGCHTSTYLDDEHAARGVDCAGCHAYVGTDLEPANVSAAISGGQRNCGACHIGMDAGHYEQHEAEPRIDDPSEPYGWNSCQNCHLNNLMVEHPRHRAPDGSYYTCDTCHANPLVAPQIAAGQTNCDACHTVHGSIIALHESPTTQRGNVIDGLECNECHATNLGTEHDKVAVACSNCHDNGDTTVIAAIDNRDTTCGACHQSYHAERSVSHTATSTASTSECGSCHDKDPDAGMNVELIHAQAAEGKCAVCHNNPARVGDISTKNAECSSCHASAGTDYHRSMDVHLSPDAATCSNQCHHRNPDVTAIHTAGCATCHPGVDTSTTSTACTNCHVVQGVDYHPNYDTMHVPTDTDSEDCARCHSEATDVRDIHATGGCGTCHTGACEDCHLPHGMTEPALRKTTKCSACHNVVGTNYHADMGASHTYSAMDSSCMMSGCHTANTLPEVHEPYMSRHTEFADSCALCHLNPSLDLAGKTADCSSCHTLHDLTALHAAPNSQACVDCHETADVRTIHADRPEGACAVCHANPDPDKGNLTSGLDSPDCTGCHGTKSPPDPNHYPAAKHAADDGALTPGGSCSGCHALDMKAEHSKSSSGPVSCVTCHETKVDAFTAAWDRSCATCHAAKHGDQTTMHTSSTPGCSGGCHGTNLETVHADLPCTVCHNNPSRVGDIFSKTADCKSCHYSPEYPYHGQQQNKHQAHFGSSNCGSCHSQALDSEHEKTTSRTSTGDPVTCETCHVGDPSWVSTVAPWDKSCAACHPLASTGHHELHLHSGLDAACQASGCHVNYLDDEHAARTDGSGNAYDCDTCHNNPDSTRQSTLDAAIGAHNKNCDACHPGAGSHYEQHASSLDEQCQICHNANLIDAHQAKGVDCEGCHRYSSGSLNGGDVSGAIEDGNKNCDACHKALHTDIKRDYNSSYHPAFEIGTNPMTGWNSWVSPWTATSITKCTDCHTASSSFWVAAKDGSKVYLVGPYPMTAKGSGARPSDLLCFNCHSSSVYGSRADSKSSGFDDLHKSEHGDYNCRLCHSVHGSPQRRLITYAKDTASGRNWLESWTQHTGSSYSKSDCYSLHQECDHHDRVGTVPATIAGTVTDGDTGSPIRGVQVAADKYQIVAQTNSSGGYTLGNLYPTTYTLTFSATGYGSQTKSVSVTSGQSVTLNVVFGQPGTIKGKVTATDGTALSGATVKTDVGGYTATTGTDGSYQLSDVPPETYTVTASKTGYQDQSKSVTVGSSQTVSCDFALETGPTNLALGKTATASSYESGYPPSYAVDGSTSTRWWKKSTSGHWLRVDLGSSTTFNKVVINWHSYYAKKYKVEVSGNGSDWSKVYETESGSSGVKTITFSSRTTRYVRVYCSSAASSNGYSIYEFEVYKQ